MLVDEYVGDNEERNEKDEKDHAHRHSINPHNVKAVVDDWELEVAEYHDGDDDCLDQVAECNYRSDSQLLWKFPEQFAWNES